MRQVFSFFFVISLVIVLGAEAIDMYEQWASVEIPIHESRQLMYSEAQDDKHGIIAITLNPTQTSKYFQTIIGLNNFF